MHCFSSLVELQCFLKLKYDTAFLSLNIFTYIFIYYNDLAVHLIHRWFTNLNFHHFKKNCMKTGISIDRVFATVFWYSVIQTFLIVLMFFTGRSWSDNLILIISHILGIGVR
jgi:hypothetical protein